MFDWIMMILLGLGYISIRNADKKSESTERPVNPIEIVPAQSPSERLERLM